MKLVLSTGVLLIVHLLILQCQGFIIRQILVNEPVTFPCICSGNQPVVLWIRFIPSSAVIAKCDSQTCWIEQYFQKRFAVSGDTSSGNYSISISSVVYTDAGSYRCSCDGHSVTEEKLQVYVPTVIKTFEGENVTLPCYGDTRVDAMNVQWKKGEETVLEITSVTTGDVSAGRCSISKEGYQDGDLSLHISSVNRSDAEFYRCLIHDESRDGDPRAVLLKVEERRPEHQPPPACNSNTEAALAVILAVTLTLVILGVIIYCVRRFKVTKNKASTDPGPPVQEENQMIPKPSSTRRFQD